MSGDLTWVAALALLVGVVSILVGVILAWGLPYALMVAGVAVVVAALTVDLP